MTAADTKRLSSKIVMTVRGNALHLGRRNGRTACNERIGGRFQHSQIAKMARALGASDYDEIATCRHCVAINQAEARRRWSVLSENGAL